MEEYPLDVGYRRDLAATHVSFAGLLFAKGDSATDATRHYQAALKLLRQLHTDYPKDADYQAELARVLTNYGVSLHLNQPSEADKAYGEAFDLWSQLWTTEKSNPQYAQERGLVMLNLAALLEGSDPARAEKTYRDATQMLTELTANFPLVPDYRHTLARSWTNLSILLARAPKRGAEAAAARRQAIPQWTKLAQSYPANADYQVGLAGCLFDEAKFSIASGEIDAGLELAEQAAQVGKQLADAHPDHMDYQIAYARRLVDVGQLYGEARKFDKEVARYTSAIQLLVGLEAQSTRSLAWLQVMIDAHFNLGVSAALRQQMDDALPEFKLARQLQQEALAKEPGSVSSQQKLIRCSLMLTNVQVELKDAAAASATALDTEPLLKADKASAGASAFTLARLVARCIPLASEESAGKLSDQALRLLDMAISQGFRNAKALDDAVFRPLRDRQEFVAALVNKLKGK